MNADLIADTFVSLCAVGGLFILRRMLSAPGARGPINDRFVFGIDVVLAMMVARVMHWLTDDRIFATAVVIAAGLIPLATLLLCEGLLQRHAPRFLKWIAAGGAVVFFVLAFFNPENVGILQAGGLLTLQVFMFVAAGYLVVTRDRSSLTSAENKTVDRIGLSLLLILPFLATDFRSELIDSPVRMAGIAVLFLCWLAISLRRSELIHRDVSGAFGMLIVLPIVAGLVIAWMAGLGMRETIQVVAIVVSAAIFSSLAVESRNLRRDQERSSLLQYIAGSNDDLETFLSGLQGNAAVADAMILRREDLADFDDTFFDALRRSPVRALPDLRHQDVSEADEQLRWFSEKYAATHLLLASEEPLTVVALNIPSLSQSPATQSELRIIQRMASLLSDKAAAA